MTGALDPLLAVAYLRLLSCDISNVGVFDADGEVLAGAAADASPGARVSASANGFTIGATQGSHGLPGLLEHDMTNALRAIDPCVA